MAVDVPTLAVSDRLDGFLADISSPKDAAQLARDFAALARAKGRDANRELVAYAKAARRCGELLLPENLPRSPGGRPRNNSSHDETSFQRTLADCLLDDSTAHRWQRLARVDPDEFEEWCDRVEAGEQDAAMRALLGNEKPNGFPKPVPEPESRELLETQPLLRFCQADLPASTIVALILRVAFPDARTALDATYGSGAFWDGSAHVRVTGVDINPGRAPHGAADFRALQFADASFDVVLFDPPHLADAGAESIMRARYGTYSDADLKAAIRDGCQEVWRVARLGVVVKVTDHVHGARFVSESDWVKAAIPEPLYDVVHQTRSGSLVDPKWEEQLSAYNNGSTYLIFRKDGPVHVRRAEP